MEHSTITVSTLFQVVIGILAVAASGYGVLLRFTFNTYKESNDRRFSELEKDSDEDEKELRKEVKDLTNANHALEKNYLSISADVRVLDAEHKNSKSHIENIQKNMVTKSEWLPRMENVETLLKQILQQTSGRHSSAQGMTATRFPIQETAKDKDK